jgi:Xaa-Pro aminopeptidase
MDRTKLTDTSRIQRLIREAKLDGVIATSPYNVTHTSGYYNLDQRLLPEHLHACLWPAQGDPVLVIPARERKLETFVRDVRTYPAYGGPPHRDIGLLAEAVRDRVGANARVGIDLESLPAFHYTQLMKQMPEVTLESADELLERMRNIKTAEEVRVMRDAAAGTDKAIAEGYAEAAAGDTEKKVVDGIDFHTLRNGAETVAFNIIASGPRSVLGHHRGEDVPISKGDIVRVDYGGIFSGYFTDLARMAVVGKPSDRQRSIYERCLHIQQKCIEECRPGTTGHEIDALARRLYAEAKMPLTRNMFGHSIGLTVHERPVFAPGDDLPLEPNMVICVENGWNDAEHRERYHIEDMVLVTKDGPRVISDQFDSSRLFVIG